MNIRSKKTFIFAAVIASALFIGVNILNNNYLSDIRFDLTDNNLYTLSQGTKNIVDSLDKNVKLKVFYSREKMNGVPYMKSYAERVIGLLRQYKNTNDGKIDLQFIDPEPFSVDEDNAVKSGIQPIPINDSGDKLYFGLVASTGDKNSETIGFFNPEREPFLEYDITRIIYKLSHPEQPVVGIISTVPERGNQLQGLLGGYNEDWVIFSQLKNQFEVQKLETDIKKIPDDIDLLMIVHPHDLADDTLYAIDQFVLSGRHALVFVDPYLEVPNSSNITSNLPSLFDSWGIKFHTDKVVADQANSLSVNYRDQDSGIRTVTKLNWLMLQSDYLNPDDIITKGLGQLRVASAGYFTKSSNNDMDVTPLVTTSKNSVAIDTHLTHSPFSVLDNYISSDKSKKQSYVIAERINGIAASAFPDRTNEGHISRSKQPINVIVFGDVDMMRDMFWVRKQNVLNYSYLIPTADNGTFVANALENLSGSNDLISLRSRSTVDRPFEVVKKLRAEAEEKYLNEEKRLEKKLKDTERKLNKIQNTEAGEGSMMLNDEQQKEVDKFRDEMVKTRKQLREVKHDLNKDISHLGAIIKFINIGLLPVIIIGLAFIIPGVLGVKRS